MKSLRGSIEYINANRMFIKIRWTSSSRLWHLMIFDSRFGAWISARHQSEKEILK